MYRKIIVLSIILLYSVLGFSQSIARQTTNIPQEEAILQNQDRNFDPDFTKQTKQISKAFGDTIYYQDFNGGLPVGWTVVDNTSNNFVWTWDTVYQSGSFTTPINTIRSTTAANGFMSLPLDFYNTPIPSTGAVPLNTYFQSATIDLTSSGLNPNGIDNVVVSYQQTFSNCCNFTNRQVLHVSTDSFATFQEFNAANTPTFNNSFGTIDYSINISTAAANATSIQMRFLSDGYSHYYWMIDDLAIVEGPKNDVELRDPYLEFNSSYTYNPFYSQIPCDLFSPLALSGFVYNNGSNDLTGVRLEGDIFNTVAGPINNPRPGIGLVYATSSTPLPLQSGIIRDTADYAITNSPLFFPPILGEFRVDLIATSDSVDENLGNENYSQIFYVSDTVFARDDNGYGGGTGPGSYARNGQAGGSAVGDRFGTMYIVESRTGSGGTRKSPTSITYAVSNDPANIGVTIVPKIWSYNEDSLFAPASGTIAAAFAGGEVASSFIPYTVLSNDTNTLLTIPLDNGSAVINGLDSGQYVVGWEVLNTNGGNSFEVQTDVSSGLFQKRVTCFIDLAHAPGWGWVDANPVIRLNLGNLTTCGLVGVEKNSAQRVDFSVHPNPNSGLFNLVINNNIKTAYNLSVQNLLGQQVYTENITVNGTITKQIDLTQFEKGVYFVSLENGAEKIIKKIILQ